MPTELQRIIRASLSKTDEFVCVCGRNYLINEEYNNSAIYIRHVQYANITENKLLSDSVCHISSTAQIHLHGLRHFTQSLYISNTFLQKYPQVSNSSFTKPLSPWPRKRQWHPTPLFLPGESQGQGSLVGCHLWGCTESDTTEAT